MNEYEALLQHLQRIEAKLDALIAALAEDGDEPRTSLDGDVLGGERDQSQSLG